MWRGFNLLLVLPLIALADSTYDLFQSDPPVQKTNTSPLVISSTGWVVTSALPVWTVVTWVKIMEVGDNSSELFSLKDSVTGLNIVITYGNLKSVAGTYNFIGQWVILGSLVSPGTNTLTFGGPWSFSVSRYISFGKIANIDPASTTLSIPATGTYTVKVLVLRVQLRDYSDSLTQAQLHCDDSCFGDCFGPDKPSCFSSPINCDSSCPETCLGTTADDCVSDSVRLFVDSWKAQTNDYPFLTPTNSMICYRSPLPTTDCTISSFTMVNPALKSPVSGWSLDAVDCTKYLNLMMPYVDLIYNKVFSSLAVATTHPGRNYSVDQQIVTIMKTWVLQFGHFELVQQEWTDFIALVAACSFQGMALDSSADPVTFTIGGVAKPLPAKLAAWLKTSRNDDFFFNLDKLDG